MLEQDYKHYTDKYGLIQPSTRDGAGETSHNGLRFTAEALVAFNNHGKLSREYKYAFLKAIFSCQSMAGLYNRYPGANQLQESVDDLCGVGLSSFILRRNYLAREILHYGRRNFGFFNNENPGSIFRLNSWKINWSAFLWRQVQVFCHLRWAAEENPNCFQKLWWIIVILMGTKRQKDDQDGWVLSWMLVKVAKKRGPIVERVRKYWIKKFKKIHPNGIGPVLGDYFGNDKHPNAVYLVGEFGE